MVSEENNSLVAQMDNSTELDANAEFKGNKEDEEDVLLTAQRYLNIFHQIHIFKEFRQKQFRQQLLEIPQEIRKVIALLPGGRVLLEHIAELMQEDGKNDPSLDALLMTLSQNDHFSDNKVSATPSAPALTAPTGTPAIAAPVVSAPIELGKDFTNALADSFKAYSQNLKDLSANIQKMALNAPAGAAGQGAPNNDYTKALTDSFQAYSQDLKDLTSSIKQIAQNHQSSSAAPTAVELGGEVAKSLTSSFDTYARNLEDLTESVKKIAANQQAPMANAPASIEFGGEVAKSLTSSFDTYARNLEDLTESVKKIAANQQQVPAIPASPASIELGEDFSKALTASFEAYSHNLENLTESIKQIAANNSAQQAPSTPGDAVLPNFTDSISAVLKENAQQQMDVLKSFGEMLSKTIADSQRELVSSIKSSNQSSMILGKFMQVPVESVDTKNNAIAYSKSMDRDFQVIETEPAPVSILSASSSENVRNTRSAAEAKTVEVPITAPQEAPKQSEPEVKVEPKKEHKPEPKKEPEIKPESKKEHKPEPKKEPEIKAEPKKEHKADSKNEIKVEPVKKSENLPKDKAKNKEDTKAGNKTSQRQEENIIDLGLTNLDTAFKPVSLNKNFELDDNEIDINDAFAQVAASLKSNTNSNKPDALAQAFDNDFSDSPKEIDKDFATPSSKKSAKDFDPMAQIRDALSSTEQVSFNDFDDDISPVSLSPVDDLQDAFSEDDTFAAQNSQNNTPTDNTTEADNTWKYIGGSASSDETSDDDEWEYEYVDEDGNPINETEDATEYEYIDENGNPINEADDVEYEYVDENGNPVEPSDDVEYEYVDEDGNPVEPSDDDTEYEYVDEDGNPIEPSDDEEWEYEYVDENGNPINNG